MNGDQTQYTHPYGEIMDFYTHSMISQKVMHLVKIWQEQSLFSIKFPFEWVYFQAAEPRGCSLIYIQKWHF